MADKLFYTYTSTWDNTSLTYTTNFPNSIIFNPTTHQIIQNGIIYSNGESGIIYIEGSSSDSAGRWTGTSTLVTRYFDGLTIIYVPKVVGLAGGTTLNINNLGAHDCYLSENIVLSTQFAANTPIMFVYIGGQWKRSDYNIDMDTTLNPIKTLTSNNVVGYLDFSMNSTSPKAVPGNASTSTYVHTYVNSALYYDISTNTLFSNKFVGNLTGLASNSTYSQYSTYVRNSSLTIWGEPFNGFNSIIGDLTDVKNITPFATTTYNVGSAVKKFNTMYAQYFDGLATKVETTSATDKKYITGVSAKDSPLYYNTQFYETNGVIYSKGMNLYGSGSAVTLASNEALYANGDLTSTRYVNSSLGFKKGTYGDTYVLLAGGGHKPLGDFAQAAGISQLATTTLFWGQEYNGTQQTVNGNMTNVGSIDASGCNVITQSGQTHTYFRAKNGSGMVELLIGQNRGVAIRNNNNTANWIIATNGTNSWTDIGYLGVGQTSPNRKLDVNGPIQMRGSNSKVLNIHGPNADWIWYETNANTGHYFNRPIGANAFSYLMNGGSKTSYMITCQNNGASYFNTCYLNITKHANFGGISLYGGVDPMIYGISMRRTSDVCGHGKIPSNSSEWAMYFNIGELSETNHNRGWIFRSNSYPSEPAASICTDGTMQVNTLGNNHYLSFVKGGQLYVTSNSTGFIKILLPSITLNTTTTLGLFVKFTVRIYNYLDNVENVDYHISGYIFKTDTNWRRTNVYTNTNCPNLDLSVHFGYDSTAQKYGVAIGSATTSWSYVTCVIMDVIGTYHNGEYGILSTLCNPWTLSITTSHGLTLASSPNGTHSKNLVYAEHANEADQWTNEITLTIGEAFEELDGSRDVEFTLHNMGAAAESHSHNDLYGNAKIFYGTCSTAAGTTTKAVTCSEFTSADLVKGTIIFVTFDYTNSGAVASLKMNVNSTGDKGLKKIYTNSVANLNAVGELIANVTYMFVYDGSTNWVCMTLDYNSNTTYSAMTDAQMKAGTSTTAYRVSPKLFGDNYSIDTTTKTINIRGTSLTVPNVSWNSNYRQLTVDNSTITISSAGIGVNYFTSDTASSTSLKVCTTDASGFQGMHGSIISVYFEEDVLAGATLQLDGTEYCSGIVYRGGLLQSGIIMGGDTATFIIDLADDQYILIAIDNLPTASFPTKAANNDLAHYIIEKDPDGRLGTCDKLFMKPSTGVYFLSDKTQKTNIKPISQEDVDTLFNSDLDLFKKFTWIDSNKDSFGVIAQEIIDYCPEAVTINDKNGLYSVNYNVLYSKVIGTLINKIKQQDKEIQEIKEILKRANLS